MSDEVKTVCGKCKDSPNMLCVFTYPNSCPFAPILNALPSAKIWYQTGRDIDGKEFDFWGIRAEREKGVESS